MKKALGILSLSVLLFSTFAPSFTYANEIDNNDIINLFSDLLNIYGMETSCEVGIEYTSGDYKGVTTENCGIKITEYNGTSTDIIIPEEMNGYQTKEIGESVFYYKGITSATIPDTVEVIGERAFEGNNFNYNPVNLPEQLKEINDYAFYNSKIRTINFNENLKNIGTYVFAYNYSNTWDDYEGIIEIPNSVKSIGTGAFQCVPIKNLRIGTGVEYIGGYAFQECYNGNYKFVSHLDELIIPDSVKVLGEYSFHYKQIDKLTLNEGLEEIGRYSFQNNYGRVLSNFSKVIIPDSVKKIGDGAFQSNHFLSEVLIGNGTGSIEIGQDSFDSCNITGFYINKETINFGYYGSFGGNPYEEILISGNNIIINNYDSYKFYWTNNNGQYTKEGKTNLTLNLSGELKNIRWDYGTIRQLNIGEKINEIGTIIFKNFYGERIAIPGNIKKIIGNSEYSMFEKELILEEGIEEIGDTAFRYNYNLKSVTLPSTIKKIGENAFRNSYKNTTLNLNEGIEEIGTGAFIYNDLENVYIPDSVKKIGNNAFCRTTTGDGNGGYMSQITNVYVMNDIIPENYNTKCLNYIRRYKINFTGDSNLIAIPERQIVDLNGNATEPNVGKTNGYEFLGWYEANSETPFDFNTPVTEDKTLYAHWKSLEEKAEETTTENVVYTNTTTVTVGDETTEETLSGSTTLTLVSKEVESNEVKKEEGTTKVQNSEIKVTSDKTVEYEGGLEVYLEKTEDTGTEVKTGKVEGTIKFSAPVAVKIPIISDAEYVKVQVKHGDEDFGYKGLTLNPVNECNNGEAVNDKYSGEDVLVTGNTQKYATIYTCSASTFVAYTENTKPAAPSPAAGGGRTIKQESKTVEQEHNSADTNKDTNTTKEETKSNNKESSKSIEEKIEEISPKALTRGELAVFSDILTEIFPKLTEGKKNINEYCSTYTDYEEFSAKEQKAVAKLCRLAIMGINEDDKTPLETFGIHNLTNNEEFIKVVNRMTDKYSDEELKDLKSALSSLEENKEGNLSFGTVVDVFKKIKELFN